LFGIDWLRNGIPIAKETSILDDEAEALDDEAEAVAEARHRTAHVVQRHPGREPDCFRLTDASGRIRGVFSLR
jgi:hypothetical protein